MTIHPYQKPRMRRLRSGWWECLSDKTVGLGQSPVQAFGDWCSRKFINDRTIRGELACENLAKNAHIFRENGELKIAI